MDPQDLPGLVGRQVRAFRALTPGARPFLHRSGALRGTDSRGYAVVEFQGAGTWPVHPEDLELT